jgi:ribosomal protein L35AE/L33A
VYVAVQRKLLGVNIKQDAAIATHKRLILYRSKMLGRYDFDDYLWRDLHDAHLSQGMVAAKFTAQHVNGQVIEMDYLSKPGSQYLYRLAQDAEEAAHEYRRQIELEQARAGATNISMGGSPSGQPATPQQPEPQANAAADPMQRLSRLKQLRENDLITEDEFQSRKQAILAEL